MQKVNVKSNSHSKGKTDSPGKAGGILETLTPVNFLTLLCEEGNLFPDLFI